MINPAAPTAAPRKLSPQAQELLNRYRAPKLVSVPSFQLADLLKGIKFRDLSPYRFIGGDLQGGGPLKTALTTLGMQAGISEANVLNIITKKAADRTACAASTVTALEKARRSLAAVSPVVEPASKISQEDQRLRRFLHTSVELQPTVESPEAIELLRKYEAAWRNALAECFMSPTEMPEYAALQARVGTFDVGDRIPFCTGLLVADGAVLTARHCFVSSNGAPVFDPPVPVFFRAADGAALEVDPETIRAVANKSYKWIEDQLLVSVAKQGVTLQPFSRRDAVTPFYSEAQTTTILLMAALPLARDLDPARFPSGFVIGKQPDTCFVAFSGSDCLTHMCSAMPGASGASLFSKEAEPKWLGIHVGPETSADSCSHTNGAIASNLAVKRLSPQIAQFIK